MGMKESFIRNYKIKESLGSNVCPCGPGSVGESVIKAGTINFINMLIEKYNITSINDCPSGLYENWVHNLNLPSRGIKYIGYDINNIVVERNKYNYPNIEFYEFDNTKEVLPKCDLIICRDCLFHFPNEFVMKALKNFKDSKSTYLLATQQRWITENKEMSQGELNDELGYKPLNLEIEPFNLGKSLEFHDEKTWNRDMSLWKIN